MRALIIGGGIAGCAAAIALHRQGIDVEVFEAREGSSDGTGAFLTLAVNGVRVLERIGVAAADVGGIPTSGMRISLGDGEPLTEFPLGDGTLTVRRADLYRELRRTVEGLGLSIRYGRRLTDLDEREDGVTAQFDDRSSASGDVLIGADGLGSRVRSLLDPRAPRARYLGLLNTGGFASGLDVPGRAGRMEMVFGRRTFFSYLPGPDGEVWWFANPSARHEPDRHDPGATGLEEWRARVLELVRGDTPMLARMVTATEPDQLFSPWPMHDFPRVPVWRSDRAVLVGDAAHAASPSSGQGASMALEDAAGLAVLLGRVSAAERASEGGAEGIADALERYELLRRPRVERVIAQGRRSSSGKAPGPLGSRLRDAFMKRYFAKPRPATDQSWLWDYDVLADPALA